MLTGIGPLLAWRKSTLVNLRIRSCFPWRWAVVVGAIVVAVGVRIWRSGLCFAFGGFVMGTDHLRSSGAVRVFGSKRAGRISSRRLIGLVGRNKRRYGGYLVHVGVVLIFLGFAGGASSYRKRRC